MTAISAATDTTLDVITRFEHRFNTRDVDGLMADMTDDCVFEHVAPEGAGFGRHEGQEAVRAVWTSMDEHFPDYTFEFVDIFAAGDRGVCRWALRWKGQDGGEATMRGVDVFALRDGKIAEKLTYATM